MYVLPGLTGISVRFAKQEPCLPLNYCPEYVRQVMRFTKLPDYLFESLELVTCLNAGIELNCQKSTKPEENHGNQMPVEAITMHG